MAKIKKADAVREYYTDKEIAEKYISKRFSDPLGRLQHNLQVKIVNKWIKKINAGNVLEIACGPARLTREVKLIDRGLAIDYSDEMLNIAKKITSNSSKWKFAKMDAFKMNINEKFDLAFTFRFIRHLKQDERKKICENAKKVLNPNGTFVFDVVNIKKNKTIRKIVGQKKYEVYDKMYSKKEFIKEMNENGFDVIKLYPITNHFFTEWAVSFAFKKLRLNKLGLAVLTALDKIPSSNPLEWVAICQKR